MSTVDIYDMAGAPQGTVDFADDLLLLEGADQLLHDVIVAHRAAQRAGSASTLGKGDVAGSNRKPRRQKGTGSARAGYRQSPVWRGGGVAFGPHPRSYAKKVNRKAKRLAFRRALSERISDGGLRVVAKIEMPEPKTKTVVNMLRALAITGPVLLVIEALDNTIVLASRNIPGMEIVSAHALNPYQLVRYQTIIATEPAIAILKDRLSANHASSAS
jgi:large subunit ribosomal protein L4